MKKEVKLQLWGKATNPVQLFEDEFLNATIKVVPIDFKGIDLERKLILIGRKGEKGEVVSVEWSLVSKWYEVINTSEIVNFLKETLEAYGKKVIKTVQVEESFKEVSVALLWKENGEVRAVIVRNAYKPGVALQVRLGKRVNSTIIPLWWFRYLHNQKGINKQVAEDLEKMDEFFEKWNRLKDLSPQTENIPEIIKEATQHLKQVKIDKKTGERQIIDYGKTIAEKGLQAPNLEVALSQMIEEAFKISRAQSWKRKLDRMALRIVLEVARLKKVKMPVFF